MRVHTYDGPIAYWTLAQAACAIAEHPGFPSTVDGLEQLQHCWYETSSSHPPKTHERRNMEWAREAFRDFGSRIYSYEAVPA